MLVDLHDKNLSLISDEMGRSAGNGQRLLGLIEGNPSVGINFVSEQLEIARTTAVNLVKAFCELGILVQPDTARQRYRAYVYEDYLSILRRGGEPL